MRKVLTLTLILLLIGINVYAFFMYMFLSEEVKSTLIERELLIVRNQKLVESLDKTQQEVIYLEGGHADSALRTKRVNEQLLQARSTIKELQLLQAELKGEKDKLNNRIKVLNDENLTLKEGWSSLRVLKKEIKEIEKEMYAIRKQIRKQIDVVATLAGNKGYLVKDGKITSQRKDFSIKVIPAEVGRN